MEVLVDKPVRELTNSELDLVYGGTLSGISHLVDITLAMMASTSAQTAAAADAQRQREDRMATLRNAYNAFFG